MVDWKRVWAKCLQIFIDQFLLISYIVAATIALAWPAPGKAVASVQFYVNGRAYQIEKIINIMIVALACPLIMPRAIPGRLLLPCALVYLMIIYHLMQCSSSVGPC